MTVKRGLRPGEGASPWAPSDVASPFQDGDATPCEQLGEPSLHQCSIGPTRRAGTGTRPYRSFNAGRSLVVATLIAHALVASVAATDATPIAYDANPAHCTVEPRRLDDLERILGLATPTALIERPVAGDPIDPASATGKSAIATIETLFACLNAGDRLRAYTLYTDAYLATVLQPGDLPTVATPQPNDPDELTRIVDIALHALPNDRVLATVTLDPALIPVDKLFGFILVPAGGSWKVDAVINEIDFSLP